MRKIIIIFSGYNQRAIQAFLATLDSHPEVECAIIASGSDDRILRSKYKDKVVYIRRHKELNLAEITFSITMAKEKFNAQLAMIAPTTEALNRFCLEHRNLFESDNCCIPLVNRKLYEQISDKKSFSDMCELNNIKVPRILEKKEITFPCVAKPTVYYGKNGQALYPHLLFSKEDYFNFCSLEEKNYFFQEFVLGESFYLLYYFGKNKQIAKLSQRNLLQQPYGKSILAAELADLHKSSISSQYEKLFVDNNFRGLVMVEVRKRQEDFYMIEANPRFWGPSQLFVSAGVNLFEAFLKDYDMIEKEKEYIFNPNAKYFWKGGIDEVLEHGEQIVELSKHTYAEVLASSEWKQYNLEMY
ncbi:MAG: hypothetical protein LUH14_08040 [Clostridiaceae bacterium]|nr:hypothetical protein [Clostridiaceae bacterium]